MEKIHADRFLSCLSRDSVVSEQQLSTPSRWSASPSRFTTGRDLDVAGGPARLSLDASKLSTGASGVFGMLNDFRGPILGSAERFLTPVVFLCWMSIVD